MKQKIRTFGPDGGNVLYKALTHPLAAPALLELEKEIFRARKEGSQVLIYDPAGYLMDVLALYPGLAPDRVFTHATEKVGAPDGLGGKLVPLVQLAESDGGVVLALSFDDMKMRARLASLLKGRPLHTLGKARLPDAFLRPGRGYLDKCNFATNFAFFRDDPHFSTRLVTADYWSGWGAQRPSYWFLLMDENGQTLAQWEEKNIVPNQGVIVDSHEIRQRFGLPDFIGQLFVHVQGACGHDVVKYALDVFGKGNNRSLSVTHDANAWPSNRFGSLPAPRKGEKLIVWVQNSHATPIPANSIGFNPMGLAGKEKRIQQEIPPYGTFACDAGEMFPDFYWPEQFEMRARKHVVRPRYEMICGELTRIAHLNVMREDLRPDPSIAEMPPAMGRGFILPFPVRDPAEFETWFQPNPMTERMESLPVRLDIFDEKGSLTNSHFLGNLKREESVTLAVHDLAKGPGHGELVYDFREGGVADGWLHGTARYRHRCSGYEAETSFGGHIYNTLMTWKNEPQSYAGPPPGLTTRIFLKLGQEYAGERLGSFCWLIYPASVHGRPDSETSLFLYGRKGNWIAEKRVSIPAGGSMEIRPDKIFPPQEIAAAGEGGYVLIRDLTCRLFGYHGLERSDGAFSLDHMFGF